jgi:hypothetical protein
LFVTIDGIREEPKQDFEVEKLDTNQFKVTNITKGESQVLDI